MENKDDEEKRNMGWYKNVKKEAKLADTASKTVASGRMYEELGPKAGTRSCTCYQMRYIKEEEDKVLVEETY